MPILFITAIIMAIFAALCFLGSLIASDEDAKSAGRFVATIFLVLSILFCMGSSANKVEVKNVGIVTSFSKPTGETTGSGLTWVKPWEKVEEWNAGKITYDWTGGDWNGSQCVRVRTATLAEACVEAIIQVQVMEKRAPEQFKDYKKDFSLFEKYITNHLRDSLNVAFVAYNPLQNIDQKTGSLNVDHSSFVSGALAEANKRIGHEVNIISVSIRKVNYDKKTEENIQRYQDLIAQARNLEQDKKNAEIRKQITETNAKVSEVFRCLEIAEKNGSNPGLCVNPGIVMGAK